MASKKSEIGKYTSILKKHYLVLDELVLRFEAMFERGMETSDLVALERLHKKCDEAVGCRDYELAELALWRSFGLRFIDERLYDGPGYESDGEPSGKASDYLVLTKKGLEALDDAENKVDEILTQGLGSWELKSFRKAMEAWHAESTPMTLPEFVRERGAELGIKIERPRAGKAKTRGKRR